MPSLSLEPFALANSQAAFSSAMAHSPSKEFSSLIRRSELIQSNSLPMLDVVNTFILLSSAALIIADTFSEYPAALE